MVDFRPKRRTRLESRPTDRAIESLGVPSGKDNRRGVRLNSRVPIAVEWSTSEKPCRGEAHTRVVSPYGCLVVLPHALEVGQSVLVTNLTNHQTNPAIVIWRGNELAEGWEIGIELVSPAMDFWGLEL